MLYGDGFKPVGDGFICPRCASNDVNIKVGFVSDLITCNKCGYQEKI
jgi:transcription elongation factor Elf1